jgi:thiol-disulfide isomerase/thioredoxin
LQNNFSFQPWCGYCKKAKPDYMRVAEDFKDDLKTSFVAVDCTKSRGICGQYKVEGFPTMFYFNFGKNPQPYDGGREYADFKRFMSDPLNPNAQRHDHSQDWIESPGYEHVNFLDDKNFDEFIQSHGRVLVMFYAPCE